MVGVQVVGLSSDVTSWDVANAGGSKGGVTTQTVEGRVRDSTRQKSGRCKGCTVRGKGTFPGFSIWGVKNSESMTIVEHFSGRD